MIINELDECHPTVITESGLKGLRDKVEKLEKEQKGLDIKFMGIYQSLDETNDFIEEMKDEIKKSAVIEATNVSNYIDDNGLPSGDLSIRHVPFHEMWIEWSGCFGAHVKAITREEHLKIVNKLIGLNLPQMESQSIKEVLKEIYDKNRELLFVNISCFFFGRSDKTFDLLGLSNFYIDINTGEIYGGGAIIPTMLGFLLFDKSEMKIEGTIKKYEMTVASTIKFMNCKNVLVKSNIPDKKLQKSRKRKNKLPLFTYKTIEIRPIRVLKEITHNKLSSDMGYSLHICRGHFKDYTKGKGLFGRIHGSFWWEEQLRGDIKYGISEHDYKIHT